MSWAIITGAGSGIGAASAHQFYKNKYSLILLGRDLSKLEATRAQLLGMPETNGDGSIHNIAFDLGRDESIRAAVKEVKALLQGSSLQCIVNNAGQFILDDDRNHSGSEIWQTMLQVNLLGTISFTEKLLPNLGPASSIVNVSSTLGLRPIRNTLAYSASKAALINWTLGMALELAPEGIRVNAVCPGIVETPIHSFYSLPEDKRQTEVNARAKAQPLGRIGQPDEIARAIYFLGSGASSWTTGTIMNVDGGIQLNS